MPENEDYFPDADKDAEEDAEENADLSELRSALRELREKLSLLDRVRAFLEEHEGDSSLVILFGALLEQAAELRADADGIADELAVLEDDLSLAVRYAGWQA